MARKEQINRLSEILLINEIEKFSSATQKFNKSLIIKSIGDDCAIFRDKNSMLISADNVTENVHFTLSNYSFFEIGSKSLLVNLSDIAAMGGIPRLFTLSLFIPCYINKKNIIETLEGITAIAKKYRVSLIGGNISRASEYSISITIIGDYKNNYVVKRGCSEPGNELYVSGEIGNAWLSYFLQNKLKNYKNLDVKTEDKKLIQRLIKKFKLPTPRIKLGEALAKAKLAESMTDISDGIYKDINNVTSYGAEIWLDKLPVNNYLKHIAELFNIDNYLDDIVSFGEDYELLWTGKEKSENELLILSKTLGIKISKIGRITDRFKGIKFFKNNIEYNINDKTFSHL